MTKRKLTQEEYENLFNLEDQTEEDDETQEDPEAIIINELYQYSQTSLNISNSVYDIPRITQQQQQQQQENNSIIDLNLYQELEFSNYQEQELYKLLNENIITLNSSNNSSNSNSSNSNSINSNIKQEVNIQPSSFNSKTALEVQPQVDTTIFSLLNNQNNTTINNVNILNIEHIAQDPISTNTIFYLTQQDISFDLIFTHPTFTGLTHIVKDIRYFSDIFLPISKVYTVSRGGFNDCMLLINSNNITVDNIVKINYIRRSNKLHNSSSGKIDFIANKDNRSIHFLLLPELIQRNTQLTFIITMNLQFEFVFKFTIKFEYKQQDRKKY